MANIKSAKKRILVANKKTANNKARKTEMRTAIKKVENAALNGETENISALLSAASRLVHKTASKGAIHKKTASRIVSRMTKKVNLSS